MENNKFNKFYSKKPVTELIEQLLGFGWAGFNSVLASDIDENCEKTFRNL